MSTNKKNYFSHNEIDEGNSLIKQSSELNVQSLYQILIKNPYLVNTIDDNKETILSYSLKNKNSEMSNLILTSPIIDLDYQDKSGNTYLHLAVLSHQEDIIKLLIEKGIYINKQNKDGDTALHLAYSINDNYIINLLIENGIDQNIVNKENIIAREIKEKNKKLNNSSNNKIKISKNKESNKKENKNSSEKSIITTKRKNATALNTNRYRKENDINKSGNNNKFITSSKSGKKLKVKNMPNTDMKKTKNESNQINHDIINIDENYKNNNNYNELNKKYLEFERTIKIDWDIAKNNINKNKEKEDEYLNYNYREKKNSFGRDQDLCNFDDNNSIYNQKNENQSEKNLNYNTKLKVNKKIYNNNKTSPKSKNIEKGKNNLKTNNNTNRTNNNNKSNSLVNSLGYNPCSSGEYTKISKNYKNTSNNQKTEISQCQNNSQVNQTNESKMNLIQNNDSFVDLNDKEKNTFHASSNFKKNISTNIPKNNPKRKTATSKTLNKKALMPINNKNKEENNLNSKSSNMESSLITQSRLKSSHNRNNPLREFLSQINLLKYLNNLDSNGFDDVFLLIEEAKNGGIVKDEELKEAGINLPGDRAKILIRIKEKANLFGFTVPKSVYYTLKNYDNIENDQHIIDLNNWLINLKVDKYLMNFVSNGYHSLELLLMQMETENPLTTELLRDEIGIDKIGYRSRILNKLKEEGKSLNNKLKTSVLVVNNKGDDKNCECFIF